MHADSEWEIVAGAMTIDPAVARLVRRELLGPDRISTDRREMLGKVAIRFDRGIT